MGFFFSTWGKPRRLWGRPVNDFLLVYEAPVAQGLLRGVQGVEDPRELVLRPQLGTDHLRVDAVRRAQQEWLGPWEATIPPESGEVFPPWPTYVRQLDREQVDGKALVMFLELDGHICGQFILSNVVGGAMMKASLGYWLSSDAAGRGVAVACAAMMLDMALGELGLHRVEVCVRPENGPSLALCRRLGLSEEGLRPRYIHINGAWADHVAFFADTESMPSGGYLHHLLELRGYLS